MIGQVFGRLTVVERGLPSVHRETMYLCKCICGNTTSVSKSKLMKGATKSCGCLLKELYASRSDSPQYRELKKALCRASERCYREACRSYARYGGRGITVCEEWRSSPESFCEWALANGWEKGLQLDRVDNNGNYEPGNCRWVTSKVNNRNRSNNRIVRVSDSTQMTLQEAVETYSVVAWSTVNSRLRSGWPEPAAILLPYMKNSKIKFEYLK